MARASRAKGVAFEREVAKVYEEHGFAVRGLEGAGDHLCIRDGLTIASEAKHHQRAQLWIWLRQLEAQAIDGTVSVLALKPPRMQVYACLPLRALLELV